MTVSVKLGVLAVTAACFTLAACRSTEPDQVNAFRNSRLMETERSRLRERIGATTVSGRFDSCLYYARRMLSFSGGDVSPADEIFALVQIGQSSFFLSRYDTASLYLNRALRLARAKNDQWGIGAAYNGLGLVAVCTRMDYYEAIKCFTASVRALENSSDGDLYHVAMANLAIAYWHRSDPAGLPYALKVLEYGRQQRKQVHVFYGTYACAAMYYLTGNYRKALAYIEETVGMADRFYDKTGVYTLSANILSAAGNTEKAATHYRLAASFLDDAEATSVLDYHLGYGRFLIGRKRYREAADVLNAGIAAARRSGNTVGRHLLWQNLSLVYRKLGMPGEALDCYEIFHTESDSIFNVERERFLSEMQVKYETEKRKKELREKQYEVLRERRRVQVTALIAAATAAVLLVVWILYKRKNALYLQIVRQYQDAIKREKALAALIPAPEEPCKAAAERYAVSSLSDEKQHLLFREIEELMRTRKVYRQYDLTKERLAETAGCNRTYLSQVINNQTGMNIVSYINAFRINEAVELLSDAANDAPLKAIAMEVGFSSLSTFYKLFKQTVGMTPMKFRENVVKLARSRGKGHPQG